MRYLCRGESLKIPKMCLKDGIRRWIDLNLGSLWTIFLFLTHEQVFFSGQQEVEEHLAIIDCEEAWVYKAVLGIFQFSFRFQDMPLNISCFQNGAYSLMNELVVYRRVSHGFGWPANAILFLPIVKGNQKLRNRTAPTASNSKKAHQTITPGFPSTPSNVLRTISLSLTTGRVKNCFSRIRLEKNHGVGWPQKTIQNSSIHHQLIPIERCPQGTTFVSNKIPTDHVPFFSVP